MRRKLPSFIPCNALRANNKPSSMPQLRPLEFALTHQMPDFNCRCTKQPSGRDNVVIQLAFVTYFPRLPLSHPLRNSPYANRRGARASVVRITTRVTRTLSRSSPTNTWITAWPISSAQLPLPHRRLMLHDIQCSIENGEGLCRGRHSHRGRRHPQSNRERRRPASSLRRRNRSACGSSDVVSRRYRAATCWASSSENCRSLISDVLGSSAK